MSLNHVDNIKQNGFFRPFDILAYLFLCIMLIVMFALMLFKNTISGEISGIKILYNGEIIGSYQFDTDLFTPDMTYDLSITTEAQTQSHTLLTITQKNGEKNILLLDRSNKHADMYDTDCSKTKDCTYMHIYKSADSIICIPHRLVILPLTDKNALPGEVIIG